MKPEQALEILKQTAAIANMNLSSHLQAQAALKVFEDLIKAQPKE